MSTKNINLILLVVLISLCLWWISPPTHHPRQLFKLVAFTLTSCVALLLLGIRKLVYGRAVETMRKEFSRFFSYSATVVVVFVRSVLPCHDVRK